MSDKKLLRYSHPAYSKYNVSKDYNLQELKKELKLDEIKALFTPVNFKWEDLSVKPIQNIIDRPKANRKERVEK